MTEALSDSFLTPDVEHPPGESRLQELARCLHRYRMNSPHSMSTQFGIRVTEQGLILYHRDRSDLSLSVDYLSGAVRHRHRYGGGRSQLLAKALGLASPKARKVIDATGGLGADALVMASLGARVKLVERQPLLALLVTDALNNAVNQDAEPSIALAADNIELYCRNSAEVLRDAVESGLPDELPDVIYLDPMFPERKKSAAVKKPMQLLQLLELGEGARSCEFARINKESAELLRLALEVDCHRVVVKRPRLAPQIEGPEPSYSLKGKSTRFDIYALKRLD